MKRFLVGTSVISLLMLGGCGGGGGGSSSDVSVAGNASGLQAAQEGETAPTQTADQTMTPVPIDLPPIADASDSNSGHTTLPTVRSIVPVTNTVTEVPEDDAGGALLETPTPPATSTSSSNPVTNQVEEDDGTTTTGGTTNPKPPKAPKPPKTPKPGSTTGGSTSGPDYGPAYQASSGNTTGGIGAASSGPIGAVPTPEPLTSSLGVLAAASLTSYALRRRR